MDTKETIQIVIGKCRLHRLIIASRVRRRTTRPANTTCHQHERPHPHCGGHLLSSGGQLQQPRHLRPAFRVLCARGDDPSANALTGSA